MAEVPMVNAQGHREIGDLVGLLENRAEHGRVRYVRPDSGKGTHEELTGAALNLRSSRAAAGLRASLAGSETETRGSVLLVVRDPLRFIVAFFAVLRSGLVPVPGPSAPHTHRGHRARLSAMVKASAPRTVITDQDGLDVLVPGVPVLSAEALETSAGQDVLPGVDVASTAYVQYTSGSLSAPKPVLLEHRHVLAQLRQAEEAFGEETDSVSVNWVPLYHDMGLVTSVLRPLWSGYTSVLLDPFDFVREPGLWPLALTEWRATHTSSPDFGYALAARKTTDVSGLDLRALRVARSAGEPVRAKTIRAFSERFGSVGFDSGAFKPSYGLAEATLTVTTCLLDEPPRILEVSSKNLREGHAVPATDPSDTREVVSCGSAVRGTRIKVIDQGSGAPLGPAELGEIWISGPQVCPPEHGVFVADGEAGHRTGDMGFLHEGELYLIGRAKERFQVSGENFYSVDLESLVDASDPRLRSGRVAVFTGSANGSGEPVPVVIAECRTGVRLDPSDGKTLARAVVSALGRECGLSIHHVLFVPQGSLPLTTSGKIQRDQCRSLFEQGSMKYLFRYERGAK